LNLILKKQSVSKTIDGKIIVNLTLELIDKKKNKRKRKQKNEIDVKVIQLINLYNKLKKSFYKNKSIIDILPTAKNIAHFKKSIAIMDRHNVKNFKAFLNAQIEGLNWTNKGKGSFPSVSHLCSSGAEDRLLNHIEDRDPIEDAFEIKVTIPQDELDMALSNNVKYQFAAKKVYDGVANLRQTIYVKKLQMVRRGKIKNWVNVHLEKITKK